MSDAADGGAPASSGGTRYEMPLWTSLVSGTVGGAAAIAIGFPFETVKVRLQTGNTSRLFSRLFAGVTAPLATVTPAWTLMYASYFAAQQFSEAYMDDWDAVTKGAFAGAVCGFACSAVTARLRRRTCSRSL